MQNSVTYQLLREEFLEEDREKGRKEGFQQGFEQGFKQGLEQGQEALRRELRQIVLELGVQRLGTPPADLEAKVNQESSVAVLRHWIGKIAEATSWDVLRSAP